MRRKGHPPIQIKLAIAIKILKWASSNSSRKY